MVKESAKNVDSQVLVSVLPSKMGRAESDKFWIKF